MTRSPAWPRRARAAGIHLLISASVAAAAALLVFLVWYPPPFDAISGGLNLFFLLVSVDVVLGPALTAVVANPAKPMTELRRDIAIIAVLQLAAFGYGMHIIALARPAYLSFEVDRMRVLTAADIETGMLQEAPEPLRSLPWFGPKLIAAVKPSNPDELVRSIELGLSGIDLSLLPRNWREYATQRDAAWRAARPVALLLKKYPQAANEVSALASAAGAPLDALRFLPLQSRRASWVTLVTEPDARVVGHLPLEGFF